MLFTKKDHKFCAYCAHGEALDEESVCCRFRGVRNANSKCMRFRYDPTKRVPPPKSPLLSSCSDEDFRL